MWETESTFEIKASFFEGTPAAFLPLQTYIEGPGNRTITTDEAGEATLPYVPAFTREQLGSFLYKRLYVTAKLPESGEITAESLITILKQRH